MKLYDGGKKSEDWASTGSAALVNPSTKQPTAQGLLTLVLAIATGLLLEQTPQLHVQKQAASSPAVAPVFPGEAARRAGGAGGGSSHLFDASRPQRKSSAARPTSRRLRLRKQSLSELWPSPN